LVCRNVNSKFLPGNRIRFWPEFFIRPGAYTGYLYSHSPEYLDADRKYDNSEYHENPDLEERYMSCFH